MIKILLKENLINEKLSSIVFHYRNMRETVNILESDEFICGMIAQDFSSYSDPEVEKKFVKDRFYYLSTARSPINHYIRRGTTSTDPAKDTSFTLECAFELDGDKLKNKYKSVTIDFFNRGATKSSTYNASDEMEDRILTHEPTIKNAHTYIKMLHVKINHVDDLVNRIDEICQSKNIPVAFYYFPDSYSVSPKKQPYGSLAARYFRKGDSLKKRPMRLNKGIYFSVKEMQEANPNDFKFKSYSKDKASTYGDLKYFTGASGSLAFLALISNVFDGTPIPAEQDKLAKEIKASLETTFAGATDAAGKYKFDSVIKQFINPISSGSALRTYPELRGGITKLTDQVKEFTNKKKISIADYNKFISDMAKRIVKTDFNSEEEGEEPKSELKENKIKIKVGKYN